MNSRLSIPGNINYFTIIIFLYFFANFWKWYFAEFEFQTFIPKLILYDSL